MKNLHTILANHVPHIKGELVNINYGGCGLFAYQLNKALTSKGISSDIVLVKWAYYNARDVRVMLSRHDTKDINAVYRKHYGRGIAPHYFDACIGHMAVRVDGKLYDSEGQHDFKAISDAIEPDVMELLLERGSWNPCFLGDNGGITQAEASDTIGTFLSNTLSEVTA